MISYSPADFMAGEKTGTNKVRLDRHTNRRMQMLTIEEVKAHCRDVLERLTESD